MRFTKYTFKHIEDVLYDYDYMKRKLETLKNDVIYAVPVVSEGSRSGVSDPTGSKGQRLVSDKTMCRMEETIWAIDRALQLLNEDHCAIFELHYRKGLNWRRVCDQLPTSKATFFRKRRQLVKMVAGQMGYEV